MPLTIQDERHTLGTHIFFRGIGPSESGKTRRWKVITNDPDGVLLGTIGWFGRWRKYVFFPTMGYPTVYEETCLEEIIEFIRGKTAEHRQKAKAART